MLESVFGLVDISPAAIRRLQRGLEDGEQKGIVDEVGALAYHDAFAERFFPGTSVLHTRARYLFFVPWVYLSLSDARVPIARFERERTRRMQAVRQRLLDSGESRGVIGRTLDHAPAQPADFSYWSALFRYELASPYTPRSQIATRWEPSRILRSGTATPRRRSEDVSSEPLIVFHVSAPPADFLADGSSLTFRLTKQEAGALIDGFGSAEVSLLSKAARMIRAGARRPTSKYPWDDRLLQDAARELQWEARLTRARQAAFLAAVVRAAYAFVVARKRQSDKKDAAANDAVDAYHEQLRRCFEQGWVEEAAGFEAHPDDDVDAHPLVRDLFLHVRERAKAVRRALDLCDRLGDDTTELRLASAEKLRKGKRARLHPITGAARRATFVASTVTVEPLHYRWGVAKQFLGDVADGLHS